MDTVDSDPACFIQQDDNLFSLDLFFLSTQFHDW